METNGFAVVSAIAAQNTHKSDTIDVCVVDSPEKRESKESSATLK